MSGRAISRRRDGGRRVGPRCGAGALDRVLVVGKLGPEPSRPWYMTSGAYEDLFLGEGTRR